MASLKIGNVDYTLVDYQAEQDGTLSAIKMVLAGSQTWMFYHPGSSSATQTIMKAGTTSFGVFKMLTSKSPQGALFWGVMTGLRLEDFISKFSSMKVAQGYYTNISSPKNPVITGRLTTRDIAS